MQRLIKTSLLVLLSSYLIAQNATVKIDGLGSIVLPSNMEIQGGAYREVSDKIKEINGISASKVIFQQKNLNSGSQNSLKTYARVFIRTEQGDAGSYQKLANFSLNSSELKELNDRYKSEIYSSAANGNATILEWYPAKMSSLNGLKCVNFGYKRKVGANSPVLVQFYFFQNNNRMHILTFEHRISEEDIWKSAFDTCKNSLTIKIQ